MECIHLLEVDWCSICLHPPKPGKAPRPDKDLWIDPKPPKDPTITLAENIAAGKVCGTCLTPITPIGCAHTLRDIYDGDVRKQRIGVVEEVQQYLESMHVLPLKERKQATGIAFGAIRRSGRRAGITADNMAADRLEVIETLQDLGNTFGGYRQQRVNEPTHLPV